MAIHESSNLIVVMGGKGGVGKSVFAANLAYAFLKEMKAKTLLIDCDPKSCGDQNFITGIRPLKTVMDVAAYAGAITEQSVQTLVTSHASGLGYIGAVLGPDQVFNVQPDLLRKNITSISHHYKYIIMDMGNDIGPVQTAMLEDATAILLVTTPEVLVVNQTRRMMNDLMSMSVPADFMQIVLNKTSRNGLDANAISASLRRPVLGGVPQDDAAALQALQRSIPMVLGNPQSPASSGFHEIVRKLTGGVLQKLKSSSRPKVTSVSKDSANAAGAAPSTAGLPSMMDPKNAKRGNRNREISPLTLLKMQVHSGLIKEMDLKKDIMNSDGDPSKAIELKNRTQRTISQLIDRLSPGLPRDDRSRVIKETLDEALGLGPLEELLADKTVTEIMVNGADMIYVEKSGKLTLSNVTFTSNDQLRNVIERIVAPLGRRIDTKTPYVDARLPDGSRVNAIIEPLSIDGPAVTIRKFPQDRITDRDYVERFGSMTRPMIDFLRICVEQGLNIVISGGTGSGKTTLLNVMSSFIPTNERIVTVEDAAELQMKQEHVVRLETRPANLEGAGEVSIRDLIKNSLRMRPDRIVVGECRDGAALDMLAAMNTGHDGSMTTVHANTPREAIARLETLCLMAGMDLPAKAIREQIGGAVHLIIQISRMSDGSRKLLYITEIVGMQGDVVSLQDIFKYKEEGFDKNRKIIGQFQATGLIPTFIEEFEQRGVTIPRNLFMSSEGAAVKPKQLSNGPKPPSVPRIGGPRAAEEDGDLTMSFIIGNEAIFIPLFGITIFIFSYFACDKIIAWFSKKSLGSREEVLELMDRMFIDSDKQKVTRTMLIASFGPAIVVFLLVWPHIILGSILGAALCMVGWMAPKAIMMNLWDRRCTRLINQMVDGMTIMANGIKAGQSLTQSMERVVENIHGPLSQEFSLVLNKVRLGMSVEDALNEFAERIPRQDVQMFVVAVNILKETGGNLAETFTTIVSTVRERQKIEKKIEALTAQGNMQAVIITLVPLMLLGIFLVLDPPYVMPLFTKPLGWVCLALMLTLQVVGLYVMRKIVTIKV